MAEKEQPTYYSILPASVRYNKNLKPNEKILYSEITALTNKDGICYATNEYFANLYGVTKTIIGQWLKSLEFEGLIKICKLDISQKLKDKSLCGFGFGNKQCEWCGINTMVLHKHHYPIPKKLGGIDIVNICPNCHHEFHYCDYEILILDKSNLEIYKEFNDVSYF